MGSWKQQGDKVATSGFGKLLSVLDNLFTLLVSALKCDLFKKKNLKILHTDVHRSFVCNSPKLETIKISCSSKWLNKLWDIHTIGCYSVKKKDRSLIRATILDLSLMAEWKTPVLKGRIFYDSIYITFLKLQNYKDTE